MLGCEGVQFDARNELRPSDLSETGLRQLRKMLDDLKLRVGSVVFPTRRGYGDPADLEPRLEGTIAAMRLASQLHARVLVIHLGRLPEDSSDDANTIMEEAILSLARHGTHLGVQLAAQVGFSNCQQLEDFMDSLPEGSLALDLHPGRLIAHGHSLDEYVSKLGKHVVHVHATDAVRESGRRQGIEVELGRGQADFPALIGSLEEYEFRGWVTIERRESHQPVEDIGNAVKYLRTL